MAIVYRDSYKNVGGNGSKTLANVSVNAGNLVVVGLYQDGALVASDCADNASGGSNDYRSAGSGVWAAGGNGCAIYVHYAVAKSDGPITITGILAGSGYNQVFCNVYSGNFDINTVLHNFGIKGETSNGVSHIGAEVNTTTENTLLFNFWGEVSGNFTISEQGQGFTERKEDVGTGTYDKLVSAQGTYYDSVLSSGASYWASIICAFQEVALSNEISALLMDDDFFLMTVLAPVIGSNQQLFSDFALFSYTGAGLPAITPTFTADNTFLFNTPAGELPPSYDATRFFMLF